MYLCNCYQPSNQIAIRGLKYINNLPEMVSDIHKYNYILQNTKYGVDVGLAIDVVAPIEIHQCRNGKNVGF